MKPALGAGRGVSTSSLRDLAVPVQSRSDKGSLPAVAPGTGVQFLQLLLFESVLTQALACIFNTICYGITCSGYCALLCGQELADAAVEHKREAQVNGKNRSDSLRLGTSKHRSCLANKINRLPPDRE